MTWTQQRPTAPGWYRIAGIREFRDSRDPFDWYWAYVHPLEGQQRYYRVSIAAVSDLQYLELRQKRLDGVLWYGPFAVPPAPVKEER